MTSIVSLGGRMGTGKTTACRTLVSWNRFRPSSLYATISSGDIARSMLQNEKTKLATMRDGLDPRELTIRRAVVDAIHKAQNDGYDIILLDGFPRTVGQWDMLCSKKETALDDYIMLTRGDAAKLAKERNRDSVGYETAVSNAQSILFDELVHQKGSSIQFTDVTGFKPFQTAKMVDTLCKVVQFGPAQAFCSFCDGVGVIKEIGNGNFLSCRPCHGTGGWKKQ
jgi:hypothetical protein